MHDGELYLSLVFKQRNLNNGKQDTKWVDFKKQSTENRYVNEIHMWYTYKGSEQF